MRIELSSDYHWKLKLYIIKKDPEENIDLDKITQVLKEKIHSIETEYMSEEFEYFRIGLIFLHFGMRGVDLSVWHFGKWENTIELFNCSWYCYGRDFSTMEILDNAEPLLCQYEIKYLINELNTVLNSLENSLKSDNFKDEYERGFCDKNVQVGPIIIT